MIDRPKRRERLRGQALVEFALVVPVFMLILGGVIQFGIWFWDQNTLNQIVRDAGRYAATVMDCSSTSNAAIVTKTQELQAQTPFAGTFGTVTVTLPAAGSSPTCPPTTNADVVWVTIKADATVPVFFPLLNGAISSTATYRMEPRVP
jgi:Flp pilus assembly protein TadG